MSAFRDDQVAAQARIDRLEYENRELTAKLEAAQRADAAQHSDAASPFVHTFVARPLVMPTTGKRGLPLLLGVCLVAVLMGGLVAGVLFRHSNDQQRELERRHETIRASRLL